MILTLNTMFKCLIICQFTLLLKLMVISFYIGCLDLETKMFEKCKSFTTIINIISLYRYGIIRTIRNSGTKGLQKFIKGLGLKT